ncbi:hypothetical protein [Priestia megaterium]
MNLTCKSCGEDKAIITYYEELRNGYVQETKCTNCGYEDSDYEF